MTPVYTDTGSNLLYIRDDGLLFVQLKPKKRELLQTVSAGTICKFARAHSIVTGVITEVTGTGVVLNDWLVEGR